MKKFTFILTSMLFLLVGGVFSQEVTTLYLDGGQNVSLSNQVYDEGSHVTGATVTFSRNTFQGKWNGLTGSNWVADLKAGETHTFTITLNSGAPAGFHFYIASNRYDDFDNANARKYVNATIPEGETSVSYSIDATTYPELLLAEGDHVGPYKWVYIVNEGIANAQLNIASITRTITTASSVAAPTISPASSTYDGDLSVTITKGEGNDRVVYSVSGADGGDINDTFTAEELANGFKVLDLTGTGPITVTATGYKGENASSAVVKTYIFDVPNRKKTITVSPSHTFNSWDQGNALHINQSEFSGMSLNDYVVLNVQDVAQDATLLGFRSNNNVWQESPFVDCTTVSRGNGAKGVINKGETLWWLKASNNDVVNAFTGHEVIMQGGMLLDETTNSSVTLNSIDIYKSITVSEGVDNTISSKEDHVVVELTRSFVAGTWNTVCLPFALTTDQATQLFGLGYQLTQFTSVSGTTMQFTTAANFEAGVPYLVKPTKDVSNTNPVVLVDVNITAKTAQTVTHKGYNEEDYSFVGNFTQKTFTEDNECNTSRFVATENKLKKPTKSSTLNSLRCYFRVPAAATARSLTFDIDEEGGTTSINTVQGSGVMVNGYYNLAGQRVAQPTKGLYIVNGKKVVIK